MQNSGTHFDNIQDTTARLQLVYQQVDKIVQIDKIAYLVCESHLNETNMQIKANLFQLISKCSFH